MVKSKPTIKKKDKLTVKQQAFIAAYTDTNKPTFGNGTQAALIAYDAKDDNTAACIAKENLRKPQIRHRVDKILDSIGYGEQVRLQQLTEIGLGKYVKTTKQTKLDAEGNTVNTIITESTPGADSIVRVNDVIAKLTGRYETAKQGSRIVSKSMQSMIDRITSQATTPIKQVKPINEKDAI
jgi:phage terminase small subunit